MENTDPTLLTLQEAAEMLSLHPETLRRWDNSGKLPAIKVNERGDRKYRKEDIARLVAASNSRSFEYKEFQIIFDSNGFENFADRFGSLAKIIVKKDQIVAGFAFAVAGLELFADPKINEVELREKALEVVKDYIDRSQVINNNVKTFELRSLQFFEVIKPDWWQSE